jgi:L-threonylcarbamoyladenylate synthase
MMINFSELSNPAMQKKIISWMKNGKIFIYPTDTIYGIGCNALNEKAIEQIRRLKKRDKKPFSIIAPSKEWILENFILKKKFQIYIERLPGPFTYILKMKNSKIVAKNVAPGYKALGVRIPNHPFMQLIQEAGKPFVTTSVNFSGEPYVKNMDELPPEFEKECVVIDAGKLKGKPSLLIDLTGEFPRILKR